MKLSMFVFFLVLTMRGHAWGPNGHRITAEIAQYHLSAETKKQIKSILNHKSLAQISNHPDFIKSDEKMRKKYSAWHYVSFSKNKSLAKRKKNKKGDILVGIEHFINQLKDKKLNRQQKEFALSFVVHLVGDLHQPLHIGYNKDRGGNQKKLTWFGEKTNLHAVWDEKLIDMQKLSYREYVDFINHVSPKNLKQWQEGDLQQWAQESRSYLDLVYKIPQGKYWEYRYNYQVLEILNERLLKGGLRLAKVLNGVYQ